MGIRDKNAGAKLAAEVIRRCTDVVLLTKRSEDLTAAYGINAAKAGQILRAEMWRRKIGG